MRRPMGPAIWQFFPQQGRYIHASSLLNSLIPPYSALAIFSTPRLLKPSVI
jgi:hypothetical protein